MAPVDIRDRILDQDEADWLYENHPKLGESFEDYCPTCKKRGTYRWRGEDWPCDCQEQLQLHKWYLASGVGLPYQRLGWDDYAGDRGALESVGRYVLDHEAYLDRGMGLMFTGPNGLGKTMLATLALKEFVKQGHSCWATTFNQTVDMLTAGYGKDGKRAAEVFRRKFLLSDVLLLDDVGRGGWGRTALPESTFDNILRTRVQAGRTTLVTTNLAVEQFGAGTYGAGVLSLLSERSLVLTLSGGDFRGEVNRRLQAEIAAGETRPIQ